MGKKTDFSTDWYFIHDDQAEYIKPELSEQGWATINLPHDWSIHYELREDAATGAGGGFAEAGIGWYRKHFTLNPQEKNQKISLLFDGIYMYATIYLNGIKIAAHNYGYTSFAVDLTDHLLAGENVIAIRVDNSHQPNSRWYSGSGIGRHVWLVTASEIHFELWGIQCATNGIYKMQDQASLQIQATICNGTKDAIHAGVIHRLYDTEGNLAATCGIGLSLESGEKGCCVARPSLNHPHLWSDEDPYLYTLESTVMFDGKIMDTEVTKVGIRTAVFDCDHGFLLNHRPVKIKGMCLHHDCGITGAAGYREVWRRRLERLKDMGCNGIRCSHNPPDPMLLELCDEMGFLVMDEIFDEWALTKNKNENYYSEQFAYGSGQFFLQDAKKELESMLHRDYNHPSVILWSIGNEIPEQSSLSGVKLLHMLQDICHSEDDSRMVTSACDNIDAPESFRTSREFENALDVVGYNYVGRWREHAENFYEKDRELFPKRRMIGSENPSVGGKRGDYSDGRYTYATMCHEPLWRYTISHDFVAGDYLWTGIDYLGETRWPSRGADFGPLDTAGFQKDAYYYFRSIWNKKEITLHLLPHWNWKGQEGQFKQVICYTNCEQVRLYINGRLVGSRGYECPRYGATKAWNDCFGKCYTTNDLHLAWDVPYEPGVLRAEGYIANKCVAVEEISTTKEAIALHERSNVTEVKVGQLAQIELECIDEDKRSVPDATPLVQCRINGNAHLIGMDSGDLYDLSLYSSDQRKMSAGLLLAIIQADAPGAIEVEFSADGLKTERVRLIAR